jgi:hypothetical protein
MIVFQMPYDLRKKVSMTLEGRFYCHGENTKALLLKDFRAIAYRPREAFGPGPIYRPVPKSPRVLAHAFDPTARPMRWTTMPSGLGMIQSAKSLRSLALAKGLAREWQAPQTAFIIRAFNLMKGGHNGQK